MVRFLWGVGIAVGRKLLSGWLQDFPVASFLGLTSLSFVVATMLFGWPGLLAMMAVHFLFHAPFAPSLITITSVFSYALAGGLAFQAFARTPGLNRAISDFKSFRWYVLVSGFGAVFSASMISLVGAHEDFFAQAGQWSRSTLVTVWLFGPPLLWLGRRWLSAWTVPIPGEPADPSQHSTGETSRLTVASGLALIAFCTAAGFLLNWLIPELGSWISLLYLVPIFWAARRHRLVGGIFAAAGCGAFYLAAQGLAADLRSVEIGDSEALEIYAQLFVFWVIGAALGEARGRESRLLDQLAESNRHLKKNLQRVIRALTGAVEAKDRYTVGHLHRVSAYALQVGRRLGLENKDQERLQIASALHDIGKIGIPESILNKPGPLDEEERRVMQTHPEIGARILSDIEGFEDAAPLVLHHQERFDGRQDGPFPGYPSSLAEEAIPLGARIIAVVDSFDAMTTDRPYRKVKTSSAARAVLIEERGRQFDPRVVDSFLTVLDEQPWASSRR